jgi:hypothetical protein
MSVIGQALKAKQPYARNFKMSNLSMPLRAKWLWSPRWTPARPSRPCSASKRAMLTSSATPRNCHRRCAAFAHHFPSLARHPRNRHHQSRCGMLTFKDDVHKAGA